MKSRYFSLENIQTINSNINESKTTTPSSSSTTSKNEPESFTQRRDYLLDKLFKSRTLPDPTNNESSTIIPLAKEIDSATNNLANKTVRSSAFQDEYIPLFDLNNKTTTSTSTATNDDTDSNNNNNKKEYNPKVNTIEAYKGPYSKKCLMRTRQYLIDLFKPYSTLYSRSNFEDRLFEILKLKMNIKSKFDNDSKLIRKIKRDTAIEKQNVYDRIDSQNRRVKSYLAKNNKASTSSKHSRFDDNDCDDEDEIIFEKSSKKAKTTPLIDLEQDDDEDDDELESNSILNLISNQETYERLDFEEEDDNIAFKEDDPDSKCIQFGNYLKKNKDNITKPNKKKKNSTTTLSRHSKNANKAIKQKSDSATNYRIDRTGLKTSNINNKSEPPQPNELNDLELKYKQLRNERNKLLRKKKGIEINEKRQLMSNELKSIRRIMKKMRRKNNHSTKKFNK